MCSSFSYLVKRVLVVKGRRCRWPRLAGRGCGAVGKRDETHAMRRQRFGRGLLQVRERRFNGPWRGLLQVPPAQGALRSCWYFFWAALSSKLLTTSRAGSSSSSMTGAGTGATAGELQSE